MKHNGLIRARIIFSAVVLFLGNVLSAQQVGINILYPDSSAILHVESKDRGFLWPRMTTTERDAIANPANGLTIFNTEDSTIQYWNTICWLNVYQRDCADCFFDLTASAIADTIDRVVTNSTTFTLTLDQNAGNPQNIAFTVLGVLPAGMTVNVSPNPLFSSGSANVVITVTPFTPAGTYPVIIQALCGSYFRNIIFSVTLTPCYLLNVNNSINNYDAAVDLYNTYPSAPTNSPVCVVVTVDAGVDVTSVSSAQPAFDMGGLPTGSVAALINNGNILGKGGDGGTVTDPVVSGSTGAGFNGGNAVNLTVNTTVQNNFNIYGGGGGGGAAAYGIILPTNLPGTCAGIPFLPDIPDCICLIVGSGGGGGAGGSLGGTSTGACAATTGPCQCGISLGNFYSPGTDGTGGQFGIPGEGGIFIVPINTSIAIIDVSINPNTIGGDGGAYGYPGTSGTFQVTLSITANITVFGVTIPITIINNMNIPLPIPIPPGGAAGYAIKRNGFTTNVPDNSYNTSFLKGIVGP